MNKLKLILIITFSMFFAQVRSENFKQENNDILNVKISWITKQPGLYIIYAVLERDSTQIVIVSTKKRCYRGEELKADSVYSLRLSLLYEDEEFVIPDHMIVYNIELEGRTFIVPTEGWTTKIYTSPDLYGLKIKRDGGSEMD